MSEGETRHLDSAERLYRQISAGQVFLGVPGENKHINLDLAVMGDIADSIASARNQVAAGETTWRCFHCHEVFTDEQSAADHFGYDELELPACIQVITETEKAIVEDRREWRMRAFHAESHNEQLHHQLHMANFDMRELDGAKDTGEAKLKYLDLKGRLLATQAILGHVIREYLALEISDDLDRAAEFRHIWKKYDPLLIDPAEYLKSMGFKE